MQEDGESTECGVDDGVLTLISLYSYFTFALLSLYSHVQEDGGLMVRGVDDGVQHARTLRSLYPHFTPTLLSLYRRMVNLPYVVWTMVYNTLLLYSHFTLTLYEDCEYGVDDGVKHALTLLAFYCYFTPTLL